ncbi:MAG: hypothetical protein U1F20_01255 [Lysobacterales bacterium]
MIWKIFKDKIVLDRVKDAAFHDAAIQEVASGTRRQGLWAKAIIEAHGDERMARIIYIKLLVLALKDEAYIAERMHAPAPAPAPAQSSPSNKSQRSGLTPDQIAQMRHYGVLHNGKYFEFGEMHFDRYDEAISYAMRQRK